jgi:WhiB family redox-sensing transcriptional regulator
MTDDYDWREGANCKGDDPELWYPDPKDPDYQETLEARRAICATCPVSAQCLSYSLSNPLTLSYGIFAGTTSVQRKKLKKELDGESDDD